MKIGLFFGSFNPVHTGHCIIANHIVTNTIVDQVWMVVSPQNPFKQSASLLNEYHRLHLVNLALEGETTIKASDAEFHLPKPSYTIETLTHLSLKHPLHTFYVIIGSDSYLNFPKWKNSDSILKYYSVIIYRRPGFDVPDPLPSNVEVVNAPLLEISATYIRENIRGGHSIRYLVPDPVKEEIQRNGYYR